MRLVPSLRRPTVAVLAVLCAALFELLVPASALAFTSTGDGSWVWQNPLPQGDDLNSVSFPNASHGFAVGSGTMVATDDGGAHWSPVTGFITHFQNQSLYGVSFSDASHGFAVGAGGQVVATSDGGADWSQPALGVTGATLYGVSCPDPNDAVAVGYYGTIIATHDGGIDWSVQDSGTGVRLYGVSFADPNDGFAVGEDGTILATTDGGNTWVAQSSGTSADLESVCCTDASHAFAVGLGGIILATSDGGANWDVQNPSGNAITWLRSVSFSDANDGVAVGSAWSGATQTYSPVVLTTSNAGSTWTAQDLSDWNAQNPDAQGFLSGVACPDGTQTAVAVGWGGIILNSSDGGADWSSYSSNVCGAQLMGIAST